LTTKKQRLALINACGWVRVSNLVLSDPSVSRDAKLLYQILSMFSFTKRVAWPGQETLSGLLGVKRNAIRKWTKELTERGLVVLTQRGSNKTNYYHLPTLDQVYADEDVESFCERSRRDAEQVRAYASYLLNQTGASVGMHPDASVGMHPDASVGMHKEQQVEEEQVEEEQASAPTAPPPAKRRSRKRRVRNPLAREIKGVDSSNSKIAEKAAALADKTERERGGFAAGTGRSRGGDGDFGRGFDRKVENDGEGVRGPRRKRSHKQVDPVPDPPHETTEFLPWSVYCSSLIRRPKSRGQGVKDFEEWTGPDFNAYIGYMAAGWLGYEEPPLNTAKTRSQAKRLLTAIGGQKAKLMLDFCLENWAPICNRLRIDAAPLPNAALIEGYLQSLQKLKKDGIQKVDVGINRVRENYDDLPAEGWG